MSILPLFLSRITYVCRLFGGAAVGGEAGRARNTNRMASMAFVRTSPAFSVSASARDDPLVRDLYDDSDDGEEVREEPVGEETAPEVAEVDGDVVFTKHTSSWASHGAGQWGAHHFTADGLASVGLVLAASAEKAPLVADLTSRARETPDIANFVHRGDSVVEVDGVVVPRDVGEVEKLLAGAPGSVVVVRLLRPLPASETLARQALASRPGNLECDRGVLYSITAVRWCPYLGSGREGAWSEADRQAILTRQPVRIEGEAPTPAEVYVPGPLEAAGRATRAGLVYRKGEGFGLPTGSGWERRHASSKEIGDTPTYSSGQAAARQTPGGGPLTQREHGQALAQALERQQRAVLKQLADIESAHGRSGAAAQAEGAAGVGAQVARLVQDHVQDLSVAAREEQCRQCGERGMGPLELRWRVASLEERSAAMVQTILSLYRQLLAAEGAGAEGAEGGRAEALLKAAVADAERRHRVREMESEERLRQQEVEIQRLQREAATAEAARDRKLRQVRADCDVELAQLAHKHAAVQSRLEAQLEALSQHVDEDSEFRKLRGDIDRVLVQQTANEEAPYGEASIATLQAQLERMRKSKQAALVAGGSSEEQQRFAAGGLVAEVEILSLTNAELVLDLHVQRQERRRFEGQVSGLQAELSDAERELLMLRPGREQLERECALLRQKVTALEAQALLPPALPHSAAAAPAEAVAAPAVLSGALAPPDSTDQRTQETEPASDMGADSEGSDRKQRAVEGLEETHTDDGTALERVIADLREELRATAAAKEQFASELAVLRGDLRLDAQELQAALTAARRQAEQAAEVATARETQLAAAAEEHRASLAALQADVEMQGRTLRAALAEAQRQLAAATKNLESTRAQMVDKDALAASLTDQVVRLERQLEQAKTDLLRAATEAGCLACRKADLGAAGSFSHGSKESPRV